jgi:HK97 family phage major capsid protein
MPTFNSIIDRDNDAAALIGEDEVNQIFQDAIQASAFLSMMRKLPNMSSKKQKLRVLSALPTAYFVDGDTGLKQTTEQKWANKYVTAEEIAVIVPIPEAVLDDAEYDIWGEVRPRIGEAIGNVVDKAIAFGTNAPAAWPDDLLTAATAASNVVTLGTGTDLYEDLLGENGTIAALEADGFMANGHVADLTMRAKLRGLRDANGVPLFQRSLQSKETYELDGSPIAFPRNGAMDATKALLISGDFNELVYSIRQDLTFKILTEAVIQDSDGTIIYNLAQQDMVALRAVIRLGWQCPNPINRVQETAASRFPVSILKPAA